MPLSNFDMQTIAEEYDEHIIEYAGLLRRMEDIKEEYQQLASSKQYNSWQLAHARRNMLQFEEFVNIAAKRVHYSYSAQLLIGMVKPCSAH